MSDDPKPAHWWLPYASNTTSLSGEDGILQEVFRRIPGDHWCVEFGAWDGKKYSNTYRLMTEDSWSGVFIEANTERFGQLKENYKDNSKAHCLHEFVTFDGASTLDRLFSRTPLPKDFDLLSIDIDGNDYHIWDALKEYQPKVVVIEFNQTIPADVEFVQPRDMSINQGNSLYSLVLLGKSKGYELIAVTTYNGIFVRKEYFPLFPVPDNSPVVLRPDGWEHFRLFQLYDGTFVVRGVARMPWQDLPLKDDTFQLIPHWLRQFPARPDGLFKRACWLFWRWLYRRRNA
jgi:hypothetical protein